MSMMVNDYPVWSDCPFRRRIPKDYVVRKINDKKSIISFEPEGESRFHVEGVFHGAGNYWRLKIALNNLGNARFIAEYGDIIGRLFFRCAEALAGGVPLTKTEKSALTRYKELTAH